jgi:tetratricopeptide (TPR) repeat protein
MPEIPSNGPDDRGPPALAGARVRRIPASADIALLGERYRAALFLDCHQLLQDLTPPEEWTDSGARLLAARTVNQLGGMRRGYRLARSTWLRDRKCAEAFYFYVLFFSARHGVFEALRLMDEVEFEGPADGTTPEQGVADLWLLKAAFLSQFRDFDAAEAWLAKGDQAQPGNAWTHVEKSVVRRGADRYDEAEAAARHALALQRDYAPAVEELAQVLILRNKDGEAESLLTDFGSRAQSAAIAHVLVGVLLERRKFAEALQVIEDAVRFSPLADKTYREWQNARKADIYYRLGRRAESLACARMIRGTYYESFARRLETADPLGGERVQLPVSFVRQHFVTCAPATISAVSAFLGKPIDHLGLARVITYDGTPDHEERHWLETNGWKVWEFRVTWDSGRALLQRGIPFTMVTTWVRNAHLQAVVGFDSTLGTFILRDPYHSVQSELLASEFLEQQAPFGPRGMVFLPPEGAARMEGIALPDAELHDAWFRLRRALVRHSRKDAEIEARRLEADAPGSRLAHLASLELASYDDNPQRVFEAVSALRALFPNEQKLRLDERAALSRLGRRDSSLETAPKRGSDMLFWRDYSDYLRVHGGNPFRARLWARRLVQFHPLDWLSLQTYAHVLWGAHEYAAAAQVYRLAATLGDKVEAAWRTYFTASRHQNRTDEALALMRARWARLGHASSQPAQTLCESLETLHRSGESHAVLDEALAQRPDDGSLRLFAAETYGRIGDFTRARAFLSAARNDEPTVAWHRTAASLAAWQADHAGALLGWRAVLAANPLDANAQREAARLLAITSGRDDALAWITGQIDRFPHFVPLRRLLLEWRRADSPSIALADIERYLGLYPNDGWAQREKALILNRARRPEEALVAALRGEELEPNVPASAGIVGYALLALRHFDEAQAAIKRGITLSIDADWLMQQLLNSCREFGERRAAIEFLRVELGRQRTLGTFFLPFQELATGVLTPAELGAALDEFRATQPEHWQTWSACRQQALAGNRLDEAKALAEEATRRFPLLARVWLDYADVHRAQNNPDGERAALARACEISPGWIAVNVRLADLHERLLHPEDATEAIRTAMSYNPLSAELHARLGRLSWGQGRPDDALASVERALELLPTYSFAWDLLATWSLERGDPKGVLALARRLAEQRPGDHEPHLRLAREYQRLRQFSEALGETEAALRISPTEVDAHDLRALLLTQLGRYDDAKAACAPPVFGADIPTNLLGRAAFVEYHRGNRKGAIGMMRKVVDSQPEYAFGWRTLADWLEKSGEIGEAAQAAERLAAVEPRSANPLGYVAHLKTKAGDRKGAVEFFERALRIDPGYQYAAKNLLRLQCEMEHFADAERTLSLLRRHATEWSALHSELLIFRAKTDETGAQAILRVLAKAPAHATGDLTAAGEVFFEARWTAGLAGTLQSVLGEKDTNPEAGSLWMRARLKIHKGPRLRWLDRCGAGDGLRRGAYVVYINSLGAKKRHLALVWQMLWRRKWLQSADSTWAAVSYALASQGLGYRRLGIRWMRDWSARAGVQPWMLYNLAHALYTIGKDGRAGKVVEAALKLPADHTRPALVAWAAMQCALRDDFAESGRLLAHFDGQSTLKGANLIAGFAQCLVDLAGSLPEKRKEAYKEQRRKMNALRASKPAEMRLRYLGRAFASAERKLGRIAKAPLAGPLAHP